MKNVFLLQTDKPSRLHEFGGIWFNHKEPTECFRNYNIYITSDEKLPYNSDIFHTGAFYHRDAAGDVHIINKDTHYPNPNFCSRIILTTDESLFKYGVQAIDDEFLEWFVKNPSIDSVRVEIKPMFPMYSTFIEHINNPPFFGNLKRKIIIPREEPKQECTCGVCDYCEEQETIQILKEAKENTLKQETLEEAAQQYAENWEEITGLDWEKTYPNDASKLDFIAGAKWQAEKMYSEEEVKMLAFNFYYDMSKKMNVPENLISENRTNFDIWFEQFKKN